MTQGGWDHTLRAMVIQKEDTMGRNWRVAMAISVLSLAVLACSPDTASKAGGEAPPLVLQIGTNDFPGRPTSAQIEEFAARVAEISEGRIQIVAEWDDGGRNTPDWDQVVARRVMSGELDMGNIPSRAWDTEGVTSLRALNAPFLITTDGLLDQVVSGDVADDMLSGLDEAGVVGLGLLPEGLRHPFGFAAPLVGPDDYDGVIIKSPTSATIEAMFHALGATVTDAEIDTEAQAGMESGYRLDPHGQATGNVVFFPKVNTLVINADVFDRLTDTQRGVLEQAAAETLQWSIETRVSDTEEAAAFCEDGGSVVIADEASVAALEERVSPVYAELESDPQTRDLIAAIRQMKQTVQVATATPTACGEVEPPGEDSEATGPSAEAGDVVSDEFPEGSFRVENTVESLMALGMNESDAFNYQGIWTLTFDRGALAIEDPAGVCNGSYSVAEGRISLHLGSDTSCGSSANEVLFTAEWSTDGDELRFVELVSVADGEQAQAILEALFAGTPMVKVD
jgi:TRAP-type C4-dicarboxylate transport system substrate-binding protein